MIKKGNFFGLLTGLFLLLAVPQSAFPASYIYSTLDYPGATYTSAVGINNSGQIVGIYIDNSLGLEHGFLTDVTNVTNNGTGYSPINYPYQHWDTAIGGINNSGQIVGIYDDGSGIHGFLTDVTKVTNNGTGYTSFDYPGAPYITDPVGINDSGQIVGSTGGFNPSRVGFLTDVTNVKNNGTNYSPINCPSTNNINYINFTNPLGINNSGQIVGACGNYFLPEQGGYQYGFLKIDGTYYSFSYESGDPTFLNGINDSGQIVGQYQDSSTKHYHGFLTDVTNVTNNGTGYTSFAYPGALQTVPACINNSGQIVGQYQDSSGNWHGFLATPVTLVASAGPDQTVQVGAVVQLDGSNSTPAASIASYQWAQLSGPPVALSDPTIVNPTFTVPMVGSNGASLVFQLTVTGTAGQTGQATCTVTVTYVNQPPVANPGPAQTVQAGDSVLLDGSGSTDPDGTIVSYQWQQTGGPPVQLSDTGAKMPTFTAPVVGTGGTVLTFQLTVTDNGDLTATATTLVNVTWVDQPPVANAGGNQTVLAGTPVTLDGSQSTDPDDGIASYLWTQLSGPPVTLSNATAPKSTFTAPHVPRGGQTLTFQLTVTDRTGLQSTATCAVTVQWVDTPPVVSAGNNVFILSKDQPTTVITGTASSVDGNSLTYQWLEGTTVLAAGPVGSDGTAPLNLVPIPQLSLGAHTFTLAVSDGIATSQSSMMLTVENSPPTVAPSGDGTYQVKTPVILGGWVADYDGDEISYTWFDGTTLLASGTVQTTEGGAPVSLPPLTTSNLKIGAHVITLQASDGINAPVAMALVVKIIDTIAPTLSPVASQTILWPPNNKMVPITIQANAADSSGLPVWLAVAVACNESQPGAVFWTTPVIDQAAGTVSLSLMAARFGNGTGRQYTITITATDDAGNTSTANVKILVPHDQGK